MFGRYIRGSPMYGQHVLRQLPSGSERQVLHSQVLRKVLLQVMYSGGPAAKPWAPPGSAQAAEALPSHPLTHIPLHHPYMLPSTVLRRPCTTHCRIHRDFCDLSRDCSVNQQCCVSVYIMDY